MMGLSPVVALAVLGDNEWNDCPDDQIDFGWFQWNNQFLGMEGNWTHNFTVFRKDNRPENFYFLHKGTLFIGLNIVGGQVHDRDEWSARLSDLFSWTEQLILEHVVTNRSALGVIIMAHANPGKNHATDYFNPLSDFIGGTLNNEYPILYLHGDGHQWVYTTIFFGQPSLLRIESPGGTRSPPLKIFADPVGRGPSATDAFWYDRQQ
jgi:hypothetical protein